MAPLSERMRPEKLEDLVGQQHLVGKGSILRTAIENSNIPSMIFWGPPGSGKTTIANIDVISTYERVLNKGYESEEMLKKVADKHFFDSDYDAAAKWYAQLIATTCTDLEAVYYYRYAQSLLAINQIEKGNEMMAIFKTKASEKK